MQKPSERHKLTSDNNIIKLKKPVHDPFKDVIQCDLRNVSKRKAGFLKVDLKGVHVLNFTN